jgi:L-fuculose-phosphate aldolase
MKHELRAEVLATAQRAHQRGLNAGTSGNVSARIAGGFLVTPSGVPYDDLRPAEIVEVRFDGTVAGAARHPSSEWRLHRDIYSARTDAAAIVHTHSMFATTLSCLRRDLPAVHYMIAVTGANLVRCARYATFGSAELAAHAVAALAGAKACLLANHGLVALGGSLREAFRIAEEVELVAAQYWRALQVGEPQVLDDAEMARVHQRFASYGRPGDGGSGRG